MQPRAVFEHIRTDDPEIFAIRIAGHLTPRQRGVVEQFIAKCRETGKRKVLFDFSELESLGGGVAQTLGEFAMELEKEGNPPCFVGAREIVRKFLTARFKDGEPCFASSLDEACSLLGEVAGARKAAPQKAKAKTKAKAEKKESPPKSGKQKDEAEDFLEIVDAVNHTAAEAERPKQRPANLPETSGYLSLSEGLELLAEEKSLDGCGPVLDRLLNSSMLANRSYLFLRKDDGFRHGDHHFAGDGILATVVERRHAPIDLVDFVELELDDEEIEVLEQLNCQVCVPFFGPEKLEGICFISKFQAGEEYSAPEIFGLEMLSRQVSDAVWSDPAVAPPVRANNGDSARRARSMQSVARQLHDSTDEEAILSRLAHGLIGEMGISGITALHLGPKGMHIRGAWGQAAPETTSWSDVKPDAWDAVRGPGSLQKFDGEWAVNLRDSGCSWFAPLAGNSRSRRALAITLRNSEDDSKVDAETLESVTSQAGFALAHSDALEDARARTLLVSRTLVSLIEKRLGHETSPETNVVAEYVARLAERMNVDRQELPDILYGTIMRDVGMIEISDMVLKSPGKLSPEEWKLVQRHPIAGAEILAGMDFSQTACDVVQHHHERFNGQGYPHGLRGTAIPVGARMVSVVESFVAMLRDTPYRPALSEEEALAVLQENWEMRYDPNVIEQFIALKQVDQTPMDIDSLLVGQTPG